MQFSTYIKDLLYRYECVIVPGFGAFLAHSNPASIVDGYQFNPPSKSLSFNRQLQTNDGLLANHVASCEGCSYETALQQIRHFTRGLSRTLDADKTLELDQIGAFQLDDNDVLSFSPSGHNFDSNAFGLAGFTAHQVDRTEQQAAVEESQIPKVRHLQERTAKPWLRYAAIGVIAVAISGLGGMKIYQDQVEKFNFAQREVAGERIEKEIQEATFILDDPLPAIEVSVPEISGKYHVIAGAYRIEANAEKKLRELRDKGFPAHRLGKNRYGLHQVAYSTHAGRTEALTSLRKAQRSDNPDAWLLLLDISGR